MDVKRLTKLVDEYLWKNWDPIGVNAYPQARSEYSSYVPGIVGMILERKSANTIGSHLYWIVNDRMGLPNPDLDAQINFAEKLLSLAGDA